MRVVRSPGWVVVFVAGAAMAGGCGSSSTAGSTTARSTSSVPAPAATSAETKTILVTDADNGGGVTVRVGDVVRVELHSTYWHLDQPASPALRPDGPPAVDVPLPGEGGCPRIPGSGCGTVTETLHAIAPGDAVVSASRTSCGEALRCAEDQSRFSVTVHVA